MTQFEVFSNPAPRVRRVYPFVVVLQADVAQRGSQARVECELKERRLQQRLSQAELAVQVQSSQSRVAKMEAGDPGVSIDLLVRSLLALGASRRFSRIPS